MKLVHLVTGLLVAGRVGSGIGAVLANMRATEQIDGIESLSIDSFKFLVVPRIVACTLALPILTLFMDFSGLLGGFFSEYATSRLSPQLYLFRAFSAFEWSNFWPPTLKTCVFGFTIGTISSFFGYTTNEGAQGVGRAATNSVVISSLLIILLDVLADQVDFLRISGERAMTRCPPPAVVFDRVSKSFGPKQVLNDVSLSVRRRRGALHSRTEWNRQERNAEAHHLAAETGYGKDLDRAGRGHATARRRALQGAPEDGTPLPGRGAL